MTKILPQGYRFLFDLLLLAVLGAVARADGPANMQWVGDFASGNPPVFHTGSGDTGPGEDWDGRNQIIVIDPEGGEIDVIKLPPEQGDNLYFDNFYTDVYAPNNLDQRSISVGNFSGMGDIRLDEYATFTGGSLNSTTNIAVYNPGDTEGLRPNLYYYLPETLQGMTLSAPVINVTSSYDIEISGGSLSANGSGLTFTGYIDPEHPLPAPMDMPLVHINGTTLNSTVTNVSGQLKLNIENSTITSLGWSLSGDDSSSNTAVTWNGVNATLSEFLVIGDPGESTLTITGGSNVQGVNAYADVGSSGHGTLFVRGNSQFNFKTFNVGNLANGDVTIDTGAQVTTSEAVLGGIEGVDGTVNLQSAMWQTDKLTVGDQGDGFIYVRAGGTLKVKDQFILGNLEGSHGTLTLIGATAQLVLQDGIINPTTASFVIGNQGSGTLNLQQGATFTSLSDVVLGANPNSSGTVTVDGTGSQWTVNGNLEIGQSSTGRVEVTDGGTLQANGSSIKLETDNGGDGTLLVDGNTSKINYNGDLIVGEISNGTFQLQNQAQFTIDSIIVGQEKTVGPFASTANGEVDITDGATLKVNGDFTIGDAGTGTLTINDQGTFGPPDNALVTTGQVVLAKQQNSMATVQLNGLGDRWTINGGKLTIGGEGAASLTMASATDIEADADVVLADSENSSGYLAVNGGTFNQNSGKLTIGGSSTANVLISAGGTLTAKSGTTVIVGDQLGGNGTVTVTGTGSKLTVSGDLFLGNTVGAVGNLDVEEFGELDLPAGADNLGLHGTVLGRGDASTGILQIGDPLGHDPIVNFQSGNVEVGLLGTGKIIVQGGAVNAANTDFLVASDPDSSGTLDISGSSTQVSLGNVLLGQGGTGLLKLSQQANLTVKQLNVSGLSTASLDTDSHLGIVGGQPLELSGAMQIAGGATVSIPNGDFDFAASSSNPGPQTISITGQSGTDSTPSSLTANNFTTGFGGTFQMLISGGASATALGTCSVDGANSLLSVSGQGSMPSHVSATSYFVGLSGAQASVLVSGGGLLEATSNSATAMVLGLNSSLTVTGAQSLARIRGTLVVAGTAAAANGGYMAANRVIILPTGFLNLSTGAMAVGGDLSALPSLPANTLDVFPGATLYGYSNLSSHPTIAGNATISGNWVIGLDLPRPGEAASGGGADGSLPAAPINVTGNVTVQPGGQIQFTIGGTKSQEQVSTLNISGAATLAGTQQIQFTGGYAPKQGDQFTLINSTQLNITPSITIANLKPGFQYSVSQIGGAWTLTALNDGVFADVLGDFNRDGVVNVDDVQAAMSALSDLPTWEENYHATNADFASIGDVDHSGAVNSSDIQALISLVANQTASGGGTGAISAVPEPATWLLMLIGAAMVVGRAIRARPLT